MYQVNEKTIDENNTVKFDVVQYNTGGLREVSGDFFCSKAGLFIFHLSAKGYFSLAVMKNDMAVFRVDEKHQGDSAILHLDLGDVIKVVAAGKSRLHGCKFSGARLA